MQSVIGQYRQKNADLEHEKVQTLTSLEQQHCKEVTAIQDQMALDFEEAQHTAHVEQSKRHIATCTNIIGFLPIPDVHSESDAEEPNLQQWQCWMSLNIASVQDLFKEVFHLMKDDDYMLYKGALYKTMQKRNHWAEQSQQSIRHDIIQKFDQCYLQRWYLRDYATSGKSFGRLQMSDYGWPEFCPIGQHDRKATGKEDLPVWVYLNFIVEMLGKDGMSPDEIEDMLWRANFNHKMQIIDEQCLAGAAIFTPRGSKPAKCLHNAKWESVWPAVAALPRAFYNSLWLNDQHLSFKVKLKSLQLMYNLYDS
ncbi:hypothetical protein BDR06DRAFT_966351 [Suillus hirtellus]|nr:hypothetical protein BDR06DRAFT_966351 [Suillus hirtellus]